MNSVTTAAEAKTGATATPRATRPIFFQGMTTGFLSTSGAGKRCDVSWRTTTPWIGTSFLMVSTLLVTAGGRGLSGGPIHQLLMKTGSSTSGAFPPTRNHQLLALAISRVLSVWGDWGELVIGNIFCLLIWGLF